VLVRSAGALEDATNRAAWLYHQRNQSTHVTDGVTVTSLSARVRQKIRAATDRQYQCFSNSFLWRNPRLWNFIYVYKRWLLAHGDYSNISNWRTNFLAIFRGIPIIICGLSK
jgi:hypothetical protein